MTKYLLPLVMAIAIAAANSFPLDSAVNLSQFELSSSARDMLSRNGFVVVPDAHEQLFEPYEADWWHGVPSFVTPDLMLQLFNLFVSTTLRRTEEEQLYFKLREFSTKMEGKFRSESDPSLAAYFEVPRRLLGGDEVSPAGADSLRRVAAYLGVPLRLLSGDSAMQAAAESLCRVELDRIDAHAGRAQSVIFPVDLDYSQFNPRGHYTRSDRLQRYFKAMMWYGLVPFPLPGPDVDERVAEKSTQNALKVSLALLESDSLVQLWQEMYDITQFFSGPSETYTPREYQAALAGTRPGRNWARKHWMLFDSAFVSNFATEIKRLRQPELHPVAVGMTIGAQFRLFGQRYLPDTDVMQQLVNWPARPLPRGLDVFAALGSNRAKQILINVHREQDGWKEYPASLAKAESAFAGRDSVFWYQNVYYAWLHALRALNEPVSKSAPRFMQSPAWQDKSLNSSLGSWSELRHEAILYATQSYAENGGPDAAGAQSYCEPEPEFYRRLLGAVGVLEQVLDRCSAKTPSMVYSLQWLLQTLRSLQTISEKELGGVDLTDEEQFQVWAICRDVEGISCTLAEGDDVAHWFQVPETDRFMACVADVANSQDRCLEVGVGAGNTIYALVPIEGKWTLTRGAVFAYREFEWPASDRLTDEKWQQMVREGKTPAPPIWTRSFTAGE
jgi:hypothetical protein